MPCGYYAHTPADMLLTPFLLLFTGILLLLVGGTSLVRGASGIARALNVPTMVVGLTVVAFGTSTPELVVSITGAMRGSTDIVFGNAVGSNLANFGLVLGVAAIMSPIGLHGQLVRREVPFLLLITAILMVMAWDRPLSNTEPLLDRGDAIILFLLFTVFIYFMVRDVIRDKEDPVLIEVTSFPTTTKQTAGKNWGLLLVGFLLLIVGGEMTITNGEAIALQLKLPEVVIGVFVVAIGTSLPELVTSAIAAHKGETDLALGNIVGSNIFNSLMVLPTAAIVKPISIPAMGNWDLAVGFVFVLAVIPLFLFSNARLGRTAGAVLLGSYLAYMLFRLNL
jgi:cation:H+ antiporter